MPKEQLGFLPALVLQLDMVAEDEFLLLGIRLG
jgi:hypothetical protein